MIVVVYVLVSENDNLLAVDTQRQSMTVGD